MTDHLADHLAHHPSGTARCRNPIGAALPGESVNDYKRKKISYVADDIPPRGECKPAAGRNLNLGRPAPRCHMTIATIDARTEM
ncbi:hypothetical protein AB7M49_001644 [Bradyrhizobium elkanii]|jgi:hypothetical protein|uniref:hypothetical protein n=1 Tax=Bradyrhizobium elkanii TaxID=29448 RepID=UPI0029FC0010|nr:hypothetical protein [Bradyrhizobium elkanii]